jgi:hypothetical protein
MYEHRRRPLLSARGFARRVGWHFLSGMAILALVLFAGVAGYHFLGGLGWIDALLNASMILGGMGPVDRLESAPAKVFASGYALFSGLAFIGVASLMIAPFAHRILHRLHLGED